MLSSIIQKTFGICILLLSCLFIMTKDLNATTSLLHSQPTYRDYNAKVTSKELKDLEFLITKMAWEKNPKRLWDLEKEMNQAGNRILHLHPFKFFEAICLDDKLCAGLKAIRDRNILIWPKFAKGSVTSLTEEHKKNNVLPHLESFSRTIKVDIKLLQPLANSQKWEELIKVVADNVQRPNNNANRYHNM